MKKEIDEHLLERVARMYYSHGMTQSEIAAEVNRSRSMVSIMLARAKELGIVDISYSIRTTQSNHDEYSELIEKKSCVQKCYVVPLSRKDEALAIRFINERAETVINGFLKGHSVIGIASGYTCSELMTSYHKLRETKNVEVVPLVGASNRTSYDIQLNDMVRLFAEKINGIPHNIFAPGCTLSAEEKELYMQSSQMKDILKKWNLMDIAVVGIGSIPGSENLNGFSITKEFIERALTEPDIPVCNICARAINMMGEEIHSLNEHLISVPFEDLRGTGKVIAIAAGVNKALSIISALRSGFIDVFITDEQTAKSVLEYYEYLEKAEKIPRKEPALSGDRHIGQAKIRELMDEYGVKGLDDIQGFISVIVSKAINEAINSGIIPSQNGQE